MKNLNDYIKSLSLVDTRACVLYIAQDLYEVYSWPAKDANMIFDKIMMNILTGKHFDSDLSPWCVACGLDEYESSTYEDEACSCCSYGKRHGICDNEDSDWKMSAIWGLGVVSGLVNYFKGMGPWYAHPYTEVLVHG